MQASRAFTFFCLAFVLQAGLSGRAFSATQATVGLCAGPGTHYATIGGAVGGTVAGGVIGICPGTYAEQVVIDKNMTLKGIAGPPDQDAAVIVPPAGGMLGNTFDVDDATLPIAACAGILIDSGTTGNTTGTETYFDVPFKIATSTSSCSIGLARHHDAGHKYSPVR